MQCNELVCITIVVENTIQKKIISRPDTRLDRVRINVYKVTHYITHLANQIVFNRS